MKKCIKTRMLTDEGWRDIRMERREESGAYYPIDGRDFELASTVMFSLPAYEIDDNTVTDCTRDLEVTWQGDSWSE